MPGLELGGTKTLKTAHKDFYKELVGEGKPFNHQIDLFILALAVGFLKNIRSKSTPASDIVKLHDLSSDEARAARNLIEIVYHIGPTHRDESDRWREILALADGGLEELWEDYQISGRVYLPKMIAEADKLAGERASELWATLRGA